MAIKSLELGNVGPFRPRPASGQLGEPVSTTSHPDIKIDFDEQVNLFIGPNNVGKSTVLDMLRLLGSENLETRFRSEERATSDRGEHGSLSVEWMAGPDERIRFNFPQVGFQYAGIDLDPWGVGSVEIPGVNDPLKFGDIIEGRNAWNNRIKDHGYVGYYNPKIDDGLLNYTRIERHTDDTYYQGIISKIRLHDSISDAVDGIGGIYSVATEDGDEEEHNPVFPVLLAFKYSRSDTERTVLDSINSVLSDITGGFLRSMATKIDDYTFDRIGYISETTDGEVVLNALSKGTMSLVDLVTHLMVGMARRYNGTADWQKQPGIFIIDEIDAHLHPSWQRRIIPTLQRHFPNVQIFASTHSPMMVAGLKAGQVHLLKRDETGRVVWSRNEQDIIGWTADEIYRTFMGIDDPTDELTVQRANRLRELRDKEARTEAEEDEMNALRRQVNEDLLAKGRINAQRERYAGLMERFLRSRMAELSQDGA